MACADGANPAQPTFLRRRGRNEVARRVTPRAIRAQSARPLDEEVEGPKLAAQLTGPLPAD
eukprot:7872893-Alexandrium_andersonii.AAC.1